MRALGPADGCFRKARTLITLKLISCAESDDASDVSQREVAAGMKKDLQAAADGTKTLPLVTKIAEPRQHFRSHDRFSTAC
jgi:hypothetical protein